MPYENLEDAIKDICKVIDDPEKFIGNPNSDEAKLLSKLQENKYFGDVEKDALTFANFFYDKVKSSKPGPLAAWADKVMTKYTGKSSYILLLLLAERQSILNSGITLAATYPEKKAYLKENYEKVMAATGRLYGCAQNNDFRLELFRVIMETCKDMDMRYSALNQKV